MGYSATNKNARYIDEDTGTIKLATNIIYNEACMTLPSNQTPLSAKTLQILGYSTTDDESSNPTSTVLKYQKLNPTAKPPTRATEGSVGYDMYNNLSSTITIKPGQTVIIPTGIAIEPPDGTFARISQNC